MDRLALMDITKIGPGIWFKIHTDGVAAITQSLKESFVININALCNGFKCKHCQPHFRKYIDEHPIENFFDIKNRKGIDIGIFQWTWEFHNAVNIRLGKYQPTLEESYEYYTNNTIGACHDCGQNKDISIKKDEVSIKKEVKTTKNISVGVKTNREVKTTKNINVNSNIVKDSNPPVIVKYEVPKDTKQFKPYAFKSSQITKDEQSFPFKMYNK